MPRRRRLQPGQTYGSGSSGIDLGGLLAGIFGGVEANPNFGKSLPAPDEAFVGPMPTDTNFYQPRWIFDRGRASELNADFAANQLLEDQAVDRTLRKEQGMNPILGERELLTGQMRNKNALALEEGRIPLETRRQKELDLLELDKEKQRGLLQLLQGLGLGGTDEDIAFYQQNLAGPSREAATQSIMAKVAEALGKRNTAEFGNRVFDETSFDRLNEAKAGAFTDASMAVGKTTMIPDMLKSQRRQIQQEPYLKEAASLSNRFHSLSPGQQLVDILSGKPVASGAVDPIKDVVAQRMRSALGGSNVNSVPNIPISSPQPQTARPEDIVIIDGVKYIKSR